MKILLTCMMYCLPLFTNRGLMAEESGLHIPSWVAFQDKATGLRANFPRAPLEMTFDLPFQNTPAKSRIHFYSVPTQNGLFVLSALRPSEVLADGLKKDDLYKFFKEILAPHFFYNPAVFLDHPIYHFQPSEEKGQSKASFQFLFKDYEVKKRLEGIALVLGQTLFIAFYLASEENFDRQLLERFLESIEY